MSVKNFINTSSFPIGEPSSYSDYFVGQSFLAPLSMELYNVTFDRAVVTTVTYTMLQSAVGRC